MEKLLAQNSRRRNLAYVLKWVVAGCSPLGSAALLHGSIVGTCSDCSAIGGLTWIIY